MLVKENTESSVLSIKRGSESPLAQWKSWDDGTDRYVKAKYWDFLWKNICWYAQREREESKNWA